MAHAAASTRRASGASPAASRINEVLHHLVVVHRPAVAEIVGERPPHDEAFALVRTDRDGVALVHVEGDRRRAMRARHRLRAIDQRRTVSASVIVRMHIKLFEPELAGYWAAAVSKKARETLINPQ